MCGPQSLPRVPHDSRRPPRAARCSAGARCCCLSIVHLPQATVLLDLHCTAVDEDPRAVDAGAHSPGQFSNGLDMTCAAALG